MSPGPSDAEVADWMKGSRTFHPRLVVRAGAAPGDALETFRHALRVAGFFTDDEGPDRFSASWRNWAGLLGWLVFEPSFERTSLQVQVRATGDGCEVVVEVGHGGEHRRGRRRGTRALNEAVRSLRSRGVAVEVGAWSGRRSS